MYVRFTLFKNRIVQPEENKEGNLTALPSERKEARDKQIHSDCLSSLFYSEIRETKEGNKRKLARQGE